MIRKKTFLLGAIFVLLVSVNAQSVINASFEKSDDIVELNGKWEFYWNKLVTSASDAGSYDTLISVPSFWKGTASEITGRETEYGVASYRTILTALEPNQPYSFFIRESPGTASNIFANGKLIASAGTVSFNEDQYKPKNCPIFCTSYSDVNGQIDVVVQVANYVHRKAGLWNTVYFGSEDAVSRFYHFNTGFSFFNIGLLFFFFIVSFILFLNDKTKIENLYFAVFLFILAIRISTAGFSVLTLMFPDIPYGLQLKLEYTGIWLAPITLTLFIEAKMHLMDNHNKLFQTFILIILITGIITSLLPISIANRTVPFLISLSFAVFVYLLIYMIVSVSCKIEGSAYYLGMILLLGVGLTADTLRSMYDISFFDFIFPVVIFVLSFYQSLFTSIGQQKMYLQSVNLTKKLKGTNDIYSCFVPKAFLSQMKKTKITNVNPGNSVTTEMVILYTKFSFSSGESRLISDSTRFTILHECFDYISSFVAFNGGIVIEYTERGIISVFPDSLKDAVDAGIRMEAEVKKLSGILEKKIGMKISVLNAADYDRISLGTVGDDSRLFCLAVAENGAYTKKLVSITSSLHRTQIVTYNAVKNELTLTKLPYILIPMGRINNPAGQKEIVFDCHSLEEREELARSLADLPVFPLDLDNTNDSHSGNKTAVGMG